MRAVGRDGSITEDLASNEVSLFRASAQAAKVRLTVDGVPRLEDLVCDGVDRKSVVWGRVCQSVYISVVAVSLTHKNRRHYHIRHKTSYELNYTDHTTIT